MYAALDALIEADMVSPIRFGGRLTVLLDIFMQQYFCTVARCGIGAKNSCRRAKLNFPAETMDFRERAKNGHDVMKVS
jgi:hypothetical protein